MKKHSLTRRCMRLLCVLLVLTAGNGGVIFANQETTAPEEQPDAFKSFFEKIKTLRKEVYGEGKEIAFTGDNLFWLLMAGGGSIALDNTNANDDIANNFSDHRALGKDSDQVVDLIGGPGIHSFAFVMLVGVLSGTYSSIFIASPLLLLKEALAGKPIAEKRR